VNILTYKNSALSIFRPEVIRDDQTWLCSMFCFIFFCYNIFMFLANGCLLCARFSFLITSQKLGKNSVLHDHFWSSSTKILTWLMRHWCIMPHNCEDGGMRRTTSCSGHESQYEWNGGPQALHGYFDDAWRMVRSVYGMIWSSSRWLTCSSAGRSRSIVHAETQQ